MIDYRCQNKRGKTQLVACLYLCWQFVAAVQQLKLSLSGE
jgi:hypothetical protein